MRRRKEFRNEGNFAFNKMETDIAPVSAYSVVLSTRSRVFSKSSSSNTKT